jgi:RNA binding exosome subunit
MEFGAARIRVILEPEEGALIERLVEKVCSVADFDLATFRSENPGVAIRTKRFSLRIASAEGLTGQLQVLEAHVHAKKDADALFSRIVSGLDRDDRVLLASTVESRTDEDHCYVRLDKKLFLNDTYVLVDHGQCIHFSFSILTYPKSREKAVVFIKKLLSDQ